MNVRYMWKIFIASLLLVQFVHYQTTLIWFDLCDHNRSCVLTVMSWFETHGWIVRLDLSYRNDIKFQTAQTKIARKLQQCSDLETHSIFILYKQKRRVSVPAAHFIQNPVKAAKGCGLKSQETHTDEKVTVSIFKHIFLGGRKGFMRRQEVMTDRKWCADRKWWEESG